MGLEPSRDRTIQWLPRYPTGLSQPYQYKFLEKLRFLRTYISRAQYASNHSRPDIRPDQQCRRLEISVY